jgi:GNAT superfamily N-acetyltransferase
MGAWDYLPGQMMIERAAWDDYKALARFHYRAGRPATVAAVWRARYEETQVTPHHRIAAVGVLSWPTISCAQRETYFHTRGISCGRRARFANTNLRTISRIIVHPQFRGIGLASALIRRMCAECPTRYTEALAVMARAHPLFETAGMKRIPSNRPGGAVYYLWDKDEGGMTKRKDDESL